MTVKRKLIIVFIIAFIVLSVVISCLKFGSLGFFICFLYFVPSLVALKQSHPLFLSVFILNLLFAWTILGWFIALVWGMNL